MKDVPLEKKPCKVAKRVLAPAEAPAPLTKRTRRSVSSLPIIPREDMGTLARKGHLSLLERKSVSVEVQNQYQKYFQLFVDFCRENGEAWPPSLECLDPLMADYMDLLYLQGRGAHEGEKTLASVEFNIVASKGKMVRSRRALKGWRKVVPALSRLPLPRVALYGIVMNLLAGGFKNMALMTLVAFYLYLRPGEAIEVKAGNVVKPVRSAGVQYQYVPLIVRDQDSGKPDKVGIYDNCIPFDLPAIQWVGQQLLDVAKGAAKKDSPLFTFSLEQYRKQFAKAASLLGLDNLHPYQLRHGGATEDMTSGARDHSSIKTRGRWRTDQSVRRYAKVGRVQQLLSKLSQKNLQFCQTSEKQVRKVFLGQMSARFNHL